MGEEPRGFEREYSEEGFWQKVARYARGAGREVVERALQLFYAAQAPETPVWAKTVIYGALGYFISLADAIPDLTPVVGYSDDLGVLVAAIATVTAYITPAIRDRARQKAKEWFGDD
ncbi:MAG: YkvA family protein [Candidatus Binatia bacterium]